MYDPPGYLWAITIAGIIAIPAATCIVLYGGAERAGLGRRRAALLAGGAAAVLGGWFAATAVIAGHGWYNTRPSQGPAGNGASHDQDRPSHRIGRRGSSLAKFCEGTHVYTRELGGQIYIINVRFIRAKRLGSTGRGKTSTFPTRWAPRATLGAPPPTPT